jgi:hypothetical protein
MIGSSWLIVRVKDDGAACCHVVTLYLGETDNSCNDVTIFFTMIGISWLMVRIKGEGAAC